MKEEFLNSSLGPFRLLSDREAILNLEFLFEKKFKKYNSISNFAKKVETQLNEYFKGKRETFDFKVAPVGTEFQKEVWKIVSKIPYGKTLTYKNVAEKLGNKNLSRAVGQALRSNKIVILIPCHRVVSKSGLGGYSGKKHIEIKRTLLRIEGIAL